MFKKKKMIKNKQVHRHILHDILRYSLTSSYSAIAAHCTTGHSLTWSLLLMGTCLSEVTSVCMCAMPNRSFLHRTKWTSGVRFVSMSEDSSSDGVCIGQRTYSS